MTKEEIQETMKELNETDRVLVDSILDGDEVCSIHKEDALYLKKLVDISDTYLKSIGKLEIQKKEVIAQYKGIVDEIAFFQKQLFQKYNIDPESGNFEVDFEKFKIFRKK